MNTLFDLPLQRSPGREHHLLLEAGPDFCAYAYLHKPTNTIESVRYLSFDRLTTEQSLAQVLAELPASEGIGQTVICSAFPQALLVPNRFFNVEQSFLPLLYAEKGTAFHDSIPEWQLATSYIVPTFFAQAVAGQFASTQFFHAFTPAIKIYNGYVADNQVILHFGAQQFRVLVKKEAAIQLAQIYDYKTPLDVVYYLLKICYEFGLAQAETHLVISGLVEKDSSLVVEMQHYFQNLHFANPPEMRLPEGDYPQYYFTSLYNLAACAS